MTGREYCDDEHRFERVGVVEWKTSRSADNKRYQTVALECRDCDAVGWKRDELACSLEAWGAA